MFHLLANSVALGVGTDLDAPAVTDDIIQVANSHFILPKQMSLLASMGFSALLTQYKLVSPTLRQIASPYVRPIFNGTTPPSNYNIALYDEFDFKLPALEEIAVQATSSIGASTERANFLHIIQDSESPLPRGQITPLRFTSTTALVANTWTTLTLTWADSIPSGIYAMVLSEHYSATAVAHRWIVSNQMWRPGYPSFTTAVMRHPYALSKGQFGVMGVFRSTDVPRLQVLGNSTDATHTGYLSAIRVGSL